MTKQAELNKMVEEKNGDFWRAVEVLIEQGWEKGDFKEAGIDEDFQNFDNPVEENYAHLDLMIAHATIDEAAKNAVEGWAVTVIWNEGTGEITWQGEGEAAEPWHVLAAHSGLGNGTPEAEHSYWEKKIAEGLREEAADTLWHLLEER